MNKRQTFIVYRKTSRWCKKTKDKLIVSFSLKESVSQNRGVPYL